MGWGGEVTAWVVGGWVVCWRGEVQRWVKLDKLPAGCHYLYPCSNLLIRFLAVPFSFRLLRAVSLQAPKSGFSLHPSVLHIALFLRVAFTRIVLHCSPFSFISPVAFFCYFSTTSGA